MKRLLLVIVACVVIVQGQSVKQTMTNSPGGVQSAGDLALPIPYDVCPKGYRCQIIEWIRDINGKREPLYYVHADGTKTVQYMIVGVEAKPKKAQRRKRHAHAQQQPKPDAPIPPLNPEASKAYNQYVTAQKELARQFEILESKKQDILRGAGVPAEARLNCAGEPVVCTKPEVAKSGP